MRRIGWLLAVLVLSGCTSGLKRPVHEVTAAATDNVQRVTITAHTYYFDPNRVILKAGKEVELTIKNGAFMVPHNLTCFEKDAGIELSENLGMFRGKKVLRFTPTRPGTYEFFCHVGSHAKHGMKGAFVVQ